MERNPKSAIRYSKKREAILQKLKSTKSHPTAEWLFQELKPLYPDLSLGTVYRNLTFFQEQGEIKSVGVVNGQERYDADVSPHCHFVCENCGRVEDFHDLHLDQTQFLQLTEERGFTVRCHELHLYGTCDRCGNTVTKDIT